MEIKKFNEMLEAKNPYKLENGVYKASKSDLDPYDLAEKAKYIVVEGPKTIVYTIIEVDNKKYFDKEVYDVSKEPGNVGKYNPRQHKKYINALLKNAKTSSEFEMNKALKGLKLQDATYWNEE